MLRERWKQEAYLLLRSEQLATGGQADECKDNTESTNR